MWRWESDPGVQVSPLIEYLDACKSLPLFLAWKRAAEHEQLHVGHQPPDPGRAGLATLADGAPRRARRTR